MLKIDNNLLQELGLSGLPEAEKNSFLKHIYETLEMRVGIRLADQMSNEQLDEFERYFEAKDDAGAFKWLETNFPNYKEIVQQEFDKLKAEVAQTAPQIMAASQAQAAQGGQQPLQQPMQQQQPMPQPMQQPQQNPMPQQQPVADQYAQQPQYQPQQPQQFQQQPQAQPPPQPQYQQQSNPMPQPQPQPQPQQGQQPQQQSYQPQQPQQFQQQPPAGPPQNQ